jgi:hypothetical protein
VSPGRARNLNGTSTWTPGDARQLRSGAPRRLDTALALDLGLDPKNIRNIDLLIGADLEDPDCLKRQDQRGLLVSEVGRDKLYRREAPVAEDSRMIALAVPC